MMNKNLIYISIIAASLAAFYFVYTKEVKRAYDQGYNKAVLDETKKYEEAVSKKEKAFKSEVEALSNIKDKWQEIATSRQQKLNALQQAKMVSNNVKNQKFDCDDIGANALRVFNDNRKAIFEYNSREIE